MVYEEAIVEAVMIADNVNTFVTRQVPRITLELGGIPGDRHYGLKRPADSRQKIYPRGVQLANRRQISLVSMEECSRIADNMGISEIKPEWLGANILVKGYGALTQLPLGTRFVFPDGTGLICEGENLPCIGPGRIIENIIGESGINKRFVAAAQKLRGIVCSVEREGDIHSSDRMRIYLR